MRSWGIRVTFVGCLLAAGGSALAQPTTVEEKKKAARALYDAGSARYDFGKYEEAIELFTRSYETYPSPVLLFNIAQAHRQLGRCKDAVFFYTRYLEKKPDAPNRAEVEGFIEDQTERCPADAGAGAGATDAGATTAGRPTGTGATTPRTAPPTTRTPPTTTGTGATTARRTTAPRTTGTGATPPPTTTAPRTTETPPPPSATTSAGATTRVAAVTDDPGLDGDPAIGAGASDVSAAPPIAARFAMGPSFPSFGELDPAPGFAFALAGAYRVAAGDLGIDAGALLSYTPVPWEGEGGETGTVGMTSLLANGGLDRELLPKLRARGELGLGFMILSGVTSPGNPFIATDEMATGALSFLNVRLGLGVEYEIADNLVLTGQPIVVSFSPTKKLRDEVGSITRFEILAGVGYKL